MRHKGDPFQLMGAIFVHRYTRIGPGWHKPEIKKTSDIIMLENYVAVTYDICEHNGLYEDMNEYVLL